MKFNDKEIAEISDLKCNLEGKLNYSGPLNETNETDCVEKWFKLKSNLLYYFKINETGETDSKEPIGIMVLEGCHVELEEQNDTNFAFSITFQDNWDEKHIFSGTSEEYILEWVELLKTSSYEYWRMQLLTLQKRISLHTLKDYFQSSRSESCTNPNNPHSQSGFRCYISKDAESLLSSPTRELTRSSWELYESLNSGGDNQKSLNDKHHNKLTATPRSIPTPLIRTERPRSIDGGKTNPFDTHDKGNETPQMDFLTVIPHPPRRSKSPKLLRARLLVNELHRTKSDSRLNENRPLPPLRRKAHGCQVTKHGSKFYISDDEDDSDNSVSVHAIYQSTCEIPTDFADKTEHKLKPEINLIEFS